MPAKQKMIRCFNCGEEIGFSTWSDPLDHCGKAECAREARYAMEAERSEAHERLDRGHGLGVMAAVEINALDVLVLKKLVLVNHALAKSLLNPLAAREQASLTKHLNEIVLRADLAITSGADAVPNGYQLVPIVPTEQMLEELARIGDGPMISGAEVWGYMLAAALSSPQGTKS